VKVSFVSVLPLSSKNTVPVSVRLPSSTKPKSMFREQSAYPAPLMEVTRSPAMVAVAETWFVPPGMPALPAFEET
jgi:hypothetical protein